MFAHPTFRLGAETFKAAALSAFVLLALHTPAPSAAPMQPAADFAPVWRTDATGTRTEIKPLLNLVPGGQAKSAAGCIGAALGAGVCKAKRTNAERAAALKVSAPWRKEG